MPKDLPRCQIITHNGPVEVIRLNKHSFFPDKSHVTICTQSFHGFPGKINFDNIEDNYWVTPFNQENHG